jgi:RNA polymerase sigma factor for flagellar operon FliA
LAIALGALLETAPDDEQGTGAADGPYQSAVRGKTRRLTLAALRDLPERERQILQAHYFEHEEFQSLAMRMGITKGRISQLHAQALRRLRQRLIAARLDQAI